LFFFVSNRVVTWGPGDSNLLFGPSTGMKERREVIAREERRLEKCKAKKAKSGSAA
jgi:hypothetical protein